MVGGGGTTFAKRPSCRDSVIVVLMSIITMTKSILSYWMIRRSNFEIEEVSSEHLAIL